MSLRAWIFVFLIISSLGYFFYQSSDLIFSPPLVIYTPQNGGAFQTTLIEITGFTEPNVAVWIDGKEARADDKGSFRDFLNLHPGYNEIGVKVTDDFGNETREVLKLVVE